MSKNTKPATHTVTNPIDENEFFQRKSPRTYTHAIVVIKTILDSDIEATIKDIASSERQLADTIANAAKAPDLTVQGRWESNQWISAIYGKDHYEDWAERVREQIARQYDRLADLRQKKDAGTRTAWCAGWSQSEANARRASQRWAGAGREIRIIPCRRSGTGIITSS